jgi:hypothetical protein
MIPDDGGSPGTARPGTELALSVIRPSHMLLSTLHLEYNLEKLSGFAGVLFLS